MPPPDDGNDYLPFVDLIQLQQLDSLTYKSIALPFSPGGQLELALPRAYGGHVYAQSAWAACQTIDTGFLLYNVVGNFHLPGSRTVPFVYRIQKLRDGRSYGTRFVTVTQEGDDEVVFTCTCSFKKPETGILDVQEEVDLWQEFKPGLENQSPKDFEEVPGMDVPWYLKLREETGHNDPFPGLESTKVDMTPYNKDRHPLDRRTLMFYRPIGRLPGDPNMHLVAHLYASDRNSLYIVTNHLDAGDLYTSMSTLVHTTIFHSSMESLLFGPSASKKSPMDDVNGNGRWFCQEDFTTRAACGRALFYSRVWAPDGIHNATVIQDGMVRFQKRPEPTNEEIRTLRGRQMSWKPKMKL